MHGIVVFKSCLSCICLCLYEVIVEIILQEQSEEDKQAWKNET